MSAVAADGTTVTMREASADDLPSLLKLYAEPGLDDRHVLSLAEARKIFSQFANYPSYRVFVACADEHIVASYAMLIMHNLAHLGAKSAIVEDVVVAAEQLGLGLATLMMRHAMGHARAEGCYKLALSSNKKRAAAHAFYESLGFTRHGYSFVVEF